MFVSKPTLDQLNQQTEDHLAAVAGPDDKFQGQVLHSILTGINENITAVVDHVQRTVEAAFLSAASGRVLDEHAQAFGLRRGQGAYPVDTSLTNVYIKIDPQLGADAATLAGMISEPGSSVLSNPDGVLIKKGARLYTVTGFTYVTTGDVSLTGAMTKVFVPVISLTTGAEANLEANGFSGHDLANQQPDLYEAAEYLLVKNRFPIDNGNAPEDDASLKYRIKQINVTAAAGNRAAVEEAALSVPGVRHVVMVEHPHGVGTVGLIVRSTLPVVSQTLLDAVQVATESVKAAGDTVYIEAPQYRAVSLSVSLLDLRPTLSSREREEVYRTVNRAVIEHINNLRLGDKLVFSDLILAARNAHSEVRDVRFDEFRTGRYDFASDTVEGWMPHYLNTQTAGANEQWLTKYIWVTTCAVD